MEVAAEALGQLLARGAAGGGSGSGDHTSGAELQQPLHQRVATIHQQHVVVGQAGEPLLHQGSHVVDAAHLLRQQDQRRRGVVAFEGLNLHRDSPVIEGLLKELPQFFRTVLAIGIFDLAVALLEGGVEFRIDPLKFELAVAHLQPRDELGVDEAVRHQHLRPLAGPERQGAGLTRLISAIEHPLGLLRAQSAAVAPQGGVSATSAGDRVQRLRLA